jgi:CheY-like chemotaxis protein
MYCWYVATSGRTIVATLPPPVDEAVDYEPRQRAASRWAAVAAADHRCVKELLQAYPIRAQRANQAENPDMPARPGRPRILLVDDDSRLVHIVTLYLQVQQFEVFSAGDAQSALDFLGNGLPDLVICDVMMPGVDGITLCRQIRALPGGDRLPLIVFTALSDTADLDAARNAGADRVICKPFNLGGLGQAVQELLPDQMAASA